MLALGNLHEIEITGLGSSGDGVGRALGLPIFVPGTAPGDIALVRITKTQKAYAYGVTERIIRPSPDRTTPPCPAFGLCGGCTLQHISYKAQLEAKKSRLRECLRRIGRLKFPQDFEVISADKPLRYRNKGSFIAANIDGQTKLGMYAAASHDLIPIVDCLLQQEDVAKILRITEGFLNARGIPAVCDTGKGIVRGLVVRHSSAYGHVGVTIKTNGVLNHAESLATILRNEVHNLAYLCLDAGKITTVYGAPYIQEHLLGLDFKISPSSFFQTNTTMAQHLYKKIADMAKITARDTMLDAYCGIGTITLLLARGAKKAYGIEASAQAVEDARFNAKGSKNVEFICEKAENATYYLENSDTVILDPPRKGCSPKLLEALMHSNVSRIVYASCEPSTLARDLSILTKSFSLRNIVMFDSFAQTSHFETAVLLERL